MLAKAGSGHRRKPFFRRLNTALYFMLLRHNPKEPIGLTAIDFICLKATAAALVRSISGIRLFPTKELWSLRQLGSILQSHPDRRTPGVEVAAGSLGQGLSVALGMSLAAKIDKKDYRVYCMLGDGETQEGNIWEAAMAGSHYKCDNLCAMLDYNGYQIDGKTRDIMDLEPLVAKWQAFGWHTIEIDGHNMKQILSAYAEAKTARQPTIIIAHNKGGFFYGERVNTDGRLPEKAEKSMKIKIKTRNATGYMLKKGTVELEA